MDKKQNKLTIVLSILVAALIIGGAIIYVVRGGSKSTVGGTQSSSTPSLADQGLSVEGLQLRGDAKAPATLLEFGDFQCVACAQYFHVVEPQIEKDLVSTGKVNEAYKVLTFIDDYAQKSGTGESWHAAQAAMCAADQGKFWEMHDVIYQAEVDEALAGKQNENSGNLTDSFFMNAAKKINLNETQFASCYNSQQHSDQIKSFMTDAVKAMGQQISTPSLYLIKNGQAQKIANPFDVASLEAMITGK